MSEATHIELTLSNSTWSDSLTPAPTFSPGNGPQYVAQSNVDTDPAEWAEGVYGELTPTFNLLPGLTDRGFSRRLHCKGNKPIPWDHCDHHCTCNP